MHDDSHCESQILIAIIRKKCIMNESVVKHLIACGVSLAGRSSKMDGLTEGVEARNGGVRGEYSDWTG